MSQWAAVRRAWGPRALAVHTADFLPSSESGSATENIISCVARNWIEVEGLTGRAATGTDDRARARIRAKKRFMTVSGGASWQNTRPRSEERRVGKECR